MYSFLLFLCLLFSSPESCGAELVIHRDDAVVIKKVTKNEHIELLIKEKFSAEAADDHTESLHYGLESPFGVYIAYQLEGMKPVAIQSFNPGAEDDYLCAYPHTNVLESYQRLKYGSTLRAQTAKYLDPFFGKQVTVSNGELSELSLSCLLSSNEWYFGENYPSLKSALNAGYGVHSIAHFGTLDMRYPNNAGLWSQNRVAAIVDFSKIMMNPSSASSPEIMVSAMDNIGFILNDLNFIKEADVTTLLSVAERVIKITHPDSFEGPDYRITMERKAIYQAIYNGPLSEVFASLNETQKQLVKRFTEKGYSPCHNFNGVLEHFKL